MLAETNVDGIRDRFLTLRALPRLSIVPDDSLRLMAEHSRRRHFAPGEVFIRAGEATSYVYIVLDGEITLTRGGRVYGTRGQAGSAGMVSLFAGESHRLTATCDSAATVLDLPSETLLDAYEENFALVRNAIRLSAGDLLSRRGDLPAIPGTEGPVELGIWRDTPRTLVERIMLDLGNPLFAGSNVEALFDFTRRRRELRLEAGDVIWRTGERADFSLRIDYGRVRCTTPAGESVSVGCGFTIGAMDPLADRPRPYDAVAETRIIADRIDVTDFLVVLETHFELTRELMAVIARAARFGRCRHRAGPTDGSRLTRLGSSRTMLDDPTAWSDPAERLRASLAAD